MKLNIGENIRRLRREKNITQEELASFLGVTFQTVSKWENDSFYPNVDLLPSIAAYFEITVDDLMGCSKAMAEKKIEEYYKKFWELDLGKESIILMKTAYTEFPNNWSIIDNYCWAMVWANKGDLSQYISEIRRLCNKIWNECTEQGYRNNAACYMSYITDDTEAAEWLDKLPWDINSSRIEIKAGRHKYREEWDKYNEQKSWNNIVYLNQFLFNIRTLPCSAEQSVASQKAALKVIDVLTDGKDSEAFLPWRAFFNTRLAAALFGSYQTTEGYSVLESAVELWLRWDDIDKDKELSYESPVFANIKSKKSGDDSVASYDLEIALRMMDIPQGWEWFNPVREEERYRALVQKIKDRLESQKINS